MKKIASLVLAAILLLGLLSACGGQNASSPSNLTPAATATPAPATEAPAATEPPATEAPATAAPAETHPQTESGNGGVAGADDMTTVEEVVEEGMTPVYAASLVDGTYPVVMKSSSSMFKADHVELVVADGTMQAVLYMTSEAYPWMFAGTAAEAAASEEGQRIPLTDGTFTLPLEALDAGESFAAYSKRKDLWYDRTLLFRSDSLPASAFAEGFFTTAQSLNLEAGTYTAEVSLSGGSGKASVQSPAHLTVKDGGCVARIEWSSSNYDYMVVDGEKFLPVSAAGENSVFEIPVLFFDRPMTVKADTTAMSTPHEIEYSLTFDSATLAAESQS